MPKFFVSFLLLIAFVCMSFSVKADKASAVLIDDLMQEIKIDGQAWKRSKLIEDFLGVAFAEEMWNEGRGYHSAYYFSSISSPQFIDNPIGVYKHFNPSKYPQAWWREYIYREKGLPTYGAITKWQNNVDISYGWPLPPYSISTFDLELALNQGSIQGALVEEISREVIPSLEQATGLKISFIAQGSEKEKSDDYARLRIVPRLWGVKSYFKDAGPYHRQGFYHDENQIGNHLDILVGGLEFAPSLRTQVEGFLLPEKDNTVGFGVCHIPPDIGQGMMKDIIVECLVRALGLPGVSRYNNDVVTGAWNKSVEDILPSKSEKKPYFKDIRSRFSTEDGRVKIPEYDLMMLKLLYCPAIKPGMDKYAAAITLVQNPDCFKQGELK